MESEKAPADTAIRNRYQGSTDNQRSDGGLRLGLGRPLWNGLVDVGIQLCQYRLGPLEHEAGLVGLEDLEVVMRPAIRCNELLAAVAVPHVSAPSSGRGDSAP